MITKQILLPLLVLCFALEDCNKLSKCKRYVGDYNDRNQILSIKYDGVNFTMVEAGQVIPCSCTNEGTLQLKGTVSTIIYLSEDSAGHKRFCFEQDTLHEDCIYARQ